MIVEQLLEFMSGKWNRSTWRMPVPVPMCLHDLNWNRTLAASLGIRRLTAWVRHEPTNVKDPYLGVLNIHTVQIQVTLSSSKLFTLYRSLPYNLTFIASVTKSFREDIWRHRKFHTLEPMCHNMPSDLSLQTKQMYSTQTSQQFQLHT
jgi:hypothetical protein